MTLVFPRRCCNGHLVAVATSRAPQAPELVAVLTKEPEHRCDAQGVDEVEGERN